MPDLGWRYEVAMSVLRDLAQPYRGRDGWRDEWDVT